MGYGLWWLWFVGHGGGGVGGNASWVSNFFFFLVVGFIWFWLANGGWPPWLPLAPLWATAMTAKPPSNFRLKHSTATIGKMNNGAVFLSLVCFYFLFNLWLGSKTFLLQFGFEKCEGFWYGFRGFNWFWMCVTENFELYLQMLCSCVHEENI